MLIEQAERRGIDRHRIPRGEERGIGNAVHRTRVGPPGVLENHPVHDREDDFFSDPVIGIDRGQRRISIPLPLREPSPVIQNPDRHHGQGPMHTGLVAVAERRDVDHLVDLAGKECGKMALVAELCGRSEKVRERTPRLLEGEITVDQLPDGRTGDRLPGVEARTLLDPAQVQSRHLVVSGLEEILPATVPDQEIARLHAGGNQSLNHRQSNLRMGSPDGPGLGGDLDADLLPGLHQRAPGLGRSRLAGDPADKPLHHAGDDRLTGRHAGTDGLLIDGEADERARGGRRRTGRGKLRIHPRRGEHTQEQRGKDPGAAHADSFGSSRSITGWPPSRR